MKRLPAPLTPADCDLKDFAFMPLEVARLRRSKQWLIAKRRPEVGFYVLNLWARSWHELPAASLEDDEDVLADAAMCSPDRWAEVRADTMRGWRKCADGRLYQHTVAEKAIEAWVSKIERHWRNECDRLRKRKQTPPSLTDYVAVFFPITARFEPDIFQRNSGGKERKSSGRPAEIQRTTGGNPAENALKGQGQGQGQGQGEVRDKLTTSAGAHARAVVAAVNHPSLDPHKSHGLVTKAGTVDRWIADFGADPEIDIIPTVRRVCETSGQARIHAWGFFTDAVREATAARIAAGQPLSPITPEELANGRPHNRNANTGRTGSKRGDMVRAALRIKADDGCRPPASDSDPGETGIPSGATARLAPPRAGE